MTTIGIIGAGELGSHVARAAIASGYQVVLANSRGPETLTVDFAARHTIPDAIAEYRAIGPERKLQRLLAPRNRWVAGAREIPGVEIVQPEEPGRYAAIGAFLLPGQKSWVDAQRVQRVFIEKHRILVVAKRGLASGPVMRVTPALFNTSEELDRLVTAIHAERGLFG